MAAGYNDGLILGRIGIPGTLGGDAAHRSRAERSSPPWQLGRGMFSEQEYRRILWASRRGMLELDLILVPFVEGRLRELDEASHRAYRRLLECEDTDLFSWFLGRGRPDDAELAGIVEQILAFAHAPRS